MYAGRIVEEGTTGEVLLRPRMPYTMGLLASVPDLDLPAEGPKRLEPIPGRVPDPGRLPPGCAFQPRCRWGVPGRCDAALPALASLDDGHRARCVRVGEIA
jgi:oligopeptide/dipeptide ABC transporter ATP-binding protein